MSQPDGSEVLGFLSRYFDKNSASLAKYKKTDGTLLGISDVSYFNRQKPACIILKIDMRINSPHKLKVGAIVINTIFIRSYTGNKYTESSHGRLSVKGEDVSIEFYDSNLMRIKSKNFSTVDDLGRILNDLFGIRVKDDENGSLNGPGTKDSLHSDDSRQNITTDILNTLHRLVDILSKESENVGENLQLIRDLVQHIEKYYPANEKK